MEHASVVDDQFKQLAIKYTELEELKEKTDEENIYYKKKEREYNKVLQEKIEMQLEIDDYIAKCNRGNRINRELETNNKILSADNKQLKAELLRYSDKNKELEFNKMDLQQKLEEMDLKMKSDALTIDDLVKKEERMGEHISVLEKKCKQQNEEI